MSKFCKILLIQNLWYMAASKLTDRQNTNVCAQCSPASVGLAQAHPNFFYTIVEPNVINKCHIVLKFIMVAHGVQKNSIMCICWPIWSSKRKLWALMEFVHERRGYLLVKLTQKGTWACIVLKICQPFLLEISIDKWTVQRCWPKHWGRGYSGKPARLVWNGLIR